MEFTLLERDPGTNARLGLLKLPHGEVKTPAFMPVGTSAAVKTTSPRELKEVGAQIVLANTYHLLLRPGVDIIQKAGGLHEFMGWDRPMLTDSGGYQVFSLASLRKVTDEGVHFQSHIDGSSHFLGPEEIMEMQKATGSDIMMVLDECVPYPADHDYTCKSLQRTIEWERQCRELHHDTNVGLFGIVQGGMFRDLREKSARAVVETDFDGNAIGGLSVGEPLDEMLELTEFTVQFLPEDRPRYLMGVGYPLDILSAVERGIDMFDCVLPTRNGRNGMAFTANGPLSVKSAQCTEDFSPIEEGCRCYACRNFTRAYLRHLLNMNEILGLHLVSLHNLYFYLNLMSHIREAIGKGKFKSFKEEFTGNYRMKDKIDEVT